MKLNWKNIAVLSGASIVMMSCSRNPDSPGYEYMPDMYRSQAIEAYVDYGMVSDDEIDSLKTKMSARKPPMGAISFKADPTMAGIHMPYSLTSSDADYELAKERQIPSHYVESEEIALAHQADGEVLYSQFCMHCHGKKGKGDGAVVTKGGFNAPNPYDGGYKDRTLGQIFHVITYGKGNMGPHGSQLNKDERWKVALHVRSLQHGDILYDEIMAGRRIGQKENVLGEVELASIKKGIYVSMRKITFATGSADLGATASQDLDTLAAYLNTNTDVLEISGHTDNTGAVETNDSLSLARAQSVVNYLMTKGVAGDRLSAAGYGSKTPIALNDTDENKARNRRIEFVKL